jgi:hypothetical protein
LLTQAADKLPALSWICAHAPEQAMSILQRRRSMAVCLVTCACAIVGACSKTTESEPAQARRAEPSQPLQRSELEDWARNATSGSGNASDNDTQRQQAVSSHDASDALATPVIHTVD